MQRKTYAIIDGVKLENNVKEIKKKYNNYDYYFGVVKNNCYHHGIKSVLDLIRGGINYLAVSSLEEAIAIRHFEKKIPILCLEPIDLEFIDDVINNEITITIESLRYLDELLKIELYSNLLIHIKIDSGMRRLGFTKKEELNVAIKKIKENDKMILEGIYSHFKTSGIVDKEWDEQVKKFLEITEQIDLSAIPIVHFGRSQTLVNHPKLSFCNGIRLGIILYGFSQSRKDGTGIKSKLRILKRKYLQKKNHSSKTTLENDLILEETLSLYSTIISCRTVNEKESIGYNSFKVKKDGYILTIPIGYADGVTKEYKEVYINNLPYEIVSDCMDMILVYSDIPMEIGTTVEIIGPNQNIKKIASRTNKNAYHILNEISNRVVRIHKKNEEKEEIYY